MRVQLFSLLQSSRLYSQLKQPAQKIEGIRYYCKL